VQATVLLCRLSHGHGLARAPSCPPAPVARAQHQASSTSTNLPPQNITAQVKSNQASALDAAVVAVGATRRAATATAAYPGPHRLPPAKGAPGIPHCQSPRATDDRDPLFPLPPRPAWHLSPIAPSAPTCPGSRHQILLPLHRGTPSAAPLLSSSRRRRTRTRTTYTFSRLPRSHARLFFFFFFTPSALFLRDGGRQEQAQATENNPPATSQEQAPYSSVEHPNTHTD
jgi:hypothetical protein